MLRAHGVTDKGCVRLVNEDCYRVEETLRLCIVADGMGGHNAGEVAARMAVDAIVEYIRETPSAKTRRPEDSGAWPFGFHREFSSSANLLRTAVHVANVQVLESSINTREYSGMGTTIVAALIDDGMLSVAHVGDSRLYLHSGEQLHQLTRDDSWVAAVLAEDPKVDPESLEHHPMRNALTNAVGARITADVHIVEQPLRGGEIFAMTTDGVHGVLDARRIGRLLLEDRDPAGIATNLVRAALARGSRDNCTAVVGRYVAG